MKRSVKKRRSPAKKHRSPAKKHRSPSKRGYRMAGAQQGRFAVIPIFLGQRRMPKGPVDSEQEALELIWQASSDIIREIRDNPRLRQYFNEHQMNVHYNNNFSPQTRADLDRALNLIWGQNFGYFLHRY